MLNNACVSMEIDRKEAGKTAFKLTDSTYGFSADYLK